MQIHTTWNHSLENKRGKDCKQTGMKRLGDKGLHTTETIITWTILVELTFYATPFCDSC